MRIAVCIKQVPATQEAVMDSEKGTLIRDNTEMVMNPYDLFALETALRLSDNQCASGITAFTMGPRTAEAVLREAFAMGVEEGVLVSDQAFAGADVLATSYTLSQAIRVSGSYDLILCGRQTTDGDTAQVGPAVAAQLGIPYLCWVTRIKEMGEFFITAEQCTAEEVSLVRMPYPCLISVDKDIAQPRLPGLRAKLEAKKRNIKVLTLANLPDSIPEHYGLDGSPTRVQKIYPPPETKVGKVIDGSDDQMIAVLAAKLFAAQKRQFGDEIWNDW